MFSNWISSWYQQNEQHQQQQLQQESLFSNIEQTVGEGDDDWVQVITPSILQQKQANNDTVTMVPHSVTTIAETSTMSDHASNGIKVLSRQERRAKARLAVNELKKQARAAAVVSGRNKKGLASSACLPASPLTV